MKTNETKTLTMQDIRRLLFVEKINNGERPALTETTGKEKTIQQTWQERINASADLRRYLRQQAGTTGTQPVFAIDGAAEPELVGEGFYHTTPSGKTRVNHPNAYGWRTWYHHSTMRIEVGADWLAEYAPCPDQWELDAIHTPASTRRFLAEYAQAEHDGWYAEQERLEREERRLYDAWSETADGSEEDRLARALYEAAKKSRQEHSRTQPTDDATRIARPYLIADGGDLGMIIADRKHCPGRVQVAVCDATTGTRHHITVPERFGAVGSEFFRRLRTPENRVRAAIAWTFDLTAEEYHPEIEA